MCLLLYSRIVTLVQSFLLLFRAICSRRVVDLLRVSVATGVSSGSSVVHLVHPAVHLVRLVRLVRLAVVDKASP